MLKRIAVVWFAFCLAGCGAEAPSVEDEIRAVVAAMASAAEARKTRGVTRHIAENYQDVDGHTKPEITNLVRGALLRGGKLVVFVDVQRIAMLSPTLVEADIAARFSAIDVQRLGLSSERYQFVVEFEQIEKEWQVVSARWRAGEGSRP